jgi:hypothetical protein
MRPSKSHETIPSNASAHETHDKCPISRRCFAQTIILDVHKWLLAGDSGEITLRIHRGRGQPPRKQDSLPESEQASSIYKHKIVI